MIDSASSTELGEPTVAQPGRAGAIGGARDGPTSAVVDRVRWSDRRRQRRKTDACQVVPYRNLIGERGDEAHATAAGPLMLKVQTMVRFVLIDLAAR